MRREERGRRETGGRQEGDEWKTRKREGERGVDRGRKGERDDKVIFNLKRNIAS